MWPNQRVQKSALWRMAETSADEPAPRGKVAHRKLTRRIVQPARTRTDRRWK